MLAKLINIGLGKKYILVNYAVDYHLLVNYPKFLQVTKKKFYDIETLVNQEGVEISHFELD